ncbi:hypothetical protein [Microcoleus sp. F4-D5]|uniref:hypothetical protein n=1 Tax=Microcoleus sp. F4-D5 TaxID=2818760 RepID=UPI002FD0AE0B
MTVDKIGRCDYGSFATTDANTTDKLPVSVEKELFSTFENKEIDCTIDGEKNITKLVIFSVVAIAQ